MENTILSALSDAGLGGPVLLQVLLTFFVAILFLQSGLDKIANYKGEQAFYQEHFKKTFLDNMVPLILPMITLFEVAAGVLCGIGTVTLLLSGNPNWGFMGMLIAAFSIIQLFFGQRMAKDYGGAAVLVPYFLLTIVGLWSYM